MSLGLYLHYPFCKNLCAYCDFYKLPYNKTLEEDYFHALEIETSLTAEKYVNIDRHITTIFIGGGTPSLIDLELFASWLDKVKSTFTIDHDVEFSLECNPDSITLEKLEALKKLGVNRPTFGIQSFNTELLQLLDRRHNPHHSQRAVYYANALGFTNYGCDMLFGLPDQSNRMLSADLKMAVELKPPHLSFYQLTIEDGTTLAARIADGSLKIPDTDTMQTFYKIGYNQLTDAGYKRYEVSSFALPGFECKHNLGYWKGESYLGLGPSAHSFIDNTRYANPGNLKEYIDSLQREVLPHRIDPAGIDARITETIMLGLHTATGINRLDFADKFGHPLEDFLDSKQYEIMLESGHLIAEQEHLRLSDEALILADEIASRIVK